MSLAPRQTEFSPTDEDRDLAQRLIDLVAAIELCENAEQVVLRLSTCRNHWLTVNAVYVDLIDAACASGELGLVRASLERAVRPGIQNPEGNLMSTWRARQRELRNRVTYAIEARTKRDVWNRRRELDADLEHAIAQCDMLQRDRLRAAVARHRDGQAPDGRQIDGVYLALSDAEDETAGGKLAELDGLQPIVHDLVILGLHLVDLLEPISSTDVAAQQTLSGLEAEAPRTERVTQAWGRARRLVRERAEQLDLRVEGDVAATQGFDLDLGADEPPEAAVVLSLIDRCAEAIDRVYNEIASMFRPNAGKAPLPGPFVIDVLEHEQISAARERNFSVERAHGTIHPTPNAATIALLHCATPARGFVGTSVNKRYVSAGVNADVAPWAANVARRAVRAAADANAVALVMPEVFLPESVVDEIHDLVRETRLTVISGVEYRTTPDGLPQNRAVVLLPGIQQPIWQLKQHPSVYESGPEQFHADERLVVVGATPLGVLGVVICSDYLEADLLWALARVPERLDTLVVCARNPQPQAFERLAAADAERLYAHVVIANAYEKAGEMSGRGSVVMAPLRASREAPAGTLSMPYIDATVHVPFEVDPLDGQEPFLAIHELDLAKIRSRDNQRSGDQTWLPAPRFARYRQPA